MKLKKLQCLLALSGLVQMSLTAQAGVVSLKGMTARQVAPARDFIL